MNVLHFMYNDVQFYQDFANSPLCPLIYQFPGKRNSQRAEKQSCVPIRSGSRLHRDMESRNQLWWVHLNSCKHVEEVM
jgi:hypothetical protein